jgi:gamma-glutamyltranspeptidase/glutathione hydrolase
MLPRGNAVDAACAAVLMAAALEPGVLLGPVHFLVTGPGFGLRCVDGRQRQPGRGAPRPRGWLPTEEVPRAARVAVPALPAAVATALSMYGTVTLRRACEPALDALTRNHPRRVVLASYAREGAATCSNAVFADAMTTIAGRFAGGLLTREDLRAVRAPAVACHVHHHMAMAPFENRGAQRSDSRRSLSGAWGAEPISIENRDEVVQSARDCQAVCVTDRRGGVVAACYETVTDGLAIDTLGLLAPLRAEPVMRGRRRKDPGAAIPCATTIALVDTLGEDRFDAGVGFAGHAPFEHLLDEASLDGALRDRAPAIGVIRGLKTARAYSFTP